MTTPMRTTAAITAVQGYLPEFRLTNQVLETLVETNDAWITERTGIKRRHMAAEGENTSDMALQASLKALEMAKTLPNELDCIIVGTISGDVQMPATAAYLAHKLGAKKAFAFSIQVRLQ